MNPFHSSPQLQLFLQQLPPATWSRPMILKRSKLQPGDIPPPLSEAKSSLPADIQQQVRRQPLPESKHRKNYLFKVGRGMNANENVIRRHSLWIHHDTQNVTREKQSHRLPPSFYTLLVYPAGGASTWKRTGRGWPGWPTKTSDSSLIGNYSRRTRNHRCRLYQLPEAKNLPVG